MTISPSWCTRRLSSRESHVCVAPDVGAGWGEAPLARSCGEGAAWTPGGSSASFLPEYMVSMVAAGMGLVEGPAESVESGGGDGGGGGGGDDGGGRRAARTNKANPQAT